MAQFQCLCPFCGASLRVSPQGLGQVQTTCPTCSKVFKVNVPASAVQSAPAQPAPKSPRTPQGTANVFDSLPSIPSASGSTGTFRHAPAYQQSPPPLPRNRPSNQASPSSRIFLIVGAVIALLVFGGIGAIFLMLDLDDVKPAAIVETLQSALDSPSQIRSDMEELAKRAEVVGRKFPEGDESEASAAKLLAFEDEFDQLKVRACRLAPVKADIDEATIKVHVDRERKPSQPHANNQPQVNTFWHANMTAKPNLKVTRAITKLTIAQIGIRALVDQNLAELPDPLTYQHEDLDWEKEDRRLLGVIRLKGQFKRDFARSLASIDPQSPSRSSLDDLHSMIDDYANKARVLIDSEGNNKFMVWVPKGTAYSRQDNASMIALISMAERLEKQGAKDHAELQFLVENARSLNEDIDDLMFNPKGTSLVKAETTSLQRYKQMLEEKAEAIAKQEREERERREAEERRIAEAEIKRREAEERRRLEAERRAKEAAADPSSVAAAGASGRGGLGSAMRGGGPPMFGPRGPRGPRTSGPRNGPMGPPTSGSGGPGMMGPRGMRFPGGRPMGPPAPGPNDVTIRIDQAAGLDTRDMMNSRPEWLRKYAMSYSMSNNKMTIRVSNFDRPLTDLKEAFAELKFDSIDKDNREITASKVDAD